MDTLADLTLLRAYVGVINNKSMLNFLCKSVLISIYELILNINSSCVNCAYFEMPLSDYVLYLSDNVLSTFHGSDVMLFVYLNST